MLALILGAVVGYVTGKLKKAIIAGAFIGIIFGILAFIVTGITAILVTGPFGVITGGAIGLFTAVFVIIVEMAMGLIGGLIGLGVKKVTK